MHKGQGLVRDVFRTRNMRSLWGNTGIGHVRYPTAGSASSLAEAQPFYVNSPFGIVLAHNGNLTNDSQLKDEMYRTDLRHINTNSDSEALLNVFAHELQKRANGFQLDQDIIFFEAIAAVHKRVKGAYAVVAIIAGYGLVAFRDPHGIRPLTLGMHDTPEGPEYLVASESVALDTLASSVCATLRRVRAFIFRLVANSTAANAIRPHSWCRVFFLSTSTLPARTP